MGTSYDRRINLYINGKEVANNVKSIRAEMTKLINEQSRMTIGSQEYIAATSRIRNLKVTLAEHNQEINKISSSWSMKSLADGVSKYFYLMTAGIATITGVIFSFKQLVKTFNDFQERVSNLSALTGLSGRSLEWLAEKAHELSTSVLEGGIRIKQSAIDIVDGFTKMGSLRPELLKHKEDLVEVTKQALILAAASKSEMGPAIEAVAASMNQFGLKASDANRIINVLGAGALAGGALVGHLTESLSTVGTVAHNSNMTLEQTVGVLETLAEHQLKGEEAGTQLKTSLISLKASGLGYTSGIFNMRDAIVELKSKMDAKNTALQKDNELITIFGKRNITVGTILTENIDRFDYFTKAVTGTNTAMIQAAINTDNNNAKLAQAHNRVSLVAEQLGEKLAPALTSVTGWFGKTLTILLALVNGFAKYAPAIITATTAIIAYSVASKISSIWEERNNKEKLLSIVITKAQALATRAQIAAVALYDLSIALLSGNLQKAAVSFRRFTLAMEANPIGLIIGLVVAAGTAFYFYTKQLSATQQAQKALNDINLDAQKRVIEERVAVGMLIDIARNENLSKMVRLDAIRKLNEISPKYLGYLNLENIATAKVDQSVKDYTDSLLENAKTEAAREALVEIEKQRLDDVTKGVDKQTTMWQKLWASMGSQGTNAANYSILIKKSETENATNALSAYQAKVKSVTDFIKQGQEDKDKLKNGNPSPQVKAIQDLILAQEDLLKIAQRMPGGTEAEIAERNKSVETIEKEIRRLKELGTTKAGEFDANEARKKKRNEKADNKDKLEALEAENKAEVSLIEKQHLDGLTSDDQYNADLLIQEFKFLGRKMEIFKAGSKEYEDAQALMLQKQVKAQQMVQELILKAENELSNARIENIQDGISKEIALEEERNKEEILVLKKQLIDKIDLTEDEFTANDIINSKLEAQKKGHLQRMADLELAKSLEKQASEAAYNMASAKTNDQLYAAKMETAQAEYDDEFAAAKNNAGKMALAEKHLADKIIAIKTDEKEARLSIGLAIADAAYSVFGQLAEIVGKETALGKAFYLFQQAAAVGQIIFNTQIANSKAVLASPLTAGEPWVTINWVLAGVSIASVLAQTIKGFSAGGYTGDGSADEPAGIVHKGEYVLSKNDVSAIGLSNLRLSVAALRANQSLAQMSLNPMVQAVNNRQNYSSGINSSGTSNGQNTIQQVSSISYEEKIFLILAKLDQTLKKPLSVNKFGHNGIAEAIDDIARYNRLIK